MHNCDRDTDLLDVGHCSPACRSGDSDAGDDGGPPPQALQNYWFHLG